MDHQDQKEPRLLWRTLETLGTLEALDPSVSPALKGTGALPVDQARMVAAVGLETLEHKDLVENQEASGRKVLLVLVVLPVTPERWGGQALKVIEEKRDPVGHLVQMGYQDQGD